MEQIKPVVAEENEYEDRDITILIVLFGNFGLEELGCNDQKQKILIQ